MEVEKKKFKDTKVGAFINKVAPAVIDTVGDIFPAANVLKALLPEDQLTDEQKKEFNVALEEYELKELQEYLKDVQDARAMNVKIQEASSGSKLSKIAAYIIDFVLIGATIILAVLLFFKKIPDDNLQIANILFGALLTYVGTIVSFHRGSTQGSSKKTDMLFSKLNNAQ
jgi:hypothetical protein